VINTARSSLLELSKDCRALLIVDECHRAGSLKNALSLRGAYDATLGLSATPVREYDDGFHQFVAPKIGGIIYEYDHADALRDGVISPFELINIEFDLLTLEREQYERWNARVRHLLRRKDRGEDVDHLLKVALQRRAAISANSLVRVPLTVKIVADEAGRRSLVFHERVDAANAILSAVRDRGVRAVIYHSGVSPHLRRDNLLLFREGVFDTLVCCRALDEGLNVPETSVAVISSSTASGRQRMQRLGRALRPAPGKACSTIYTLFSTAPERERLERESERLREAANIQWYRARVPIG
jgi:superfamily II DNA or RNA helicase